MANLTLNLNIYSAKDLENVNLITKMDVYAVVWINGDGSQKCKKEKTPIDRTGGSEPTWNHAVKFSIDQRLAREGRLTLVVRLVCDRIIAGRNLGEVQVPVLELLHGSSSPSFNGNSNGQGMMRFVTYQVRTPGGKGQGSLTFSYRFDTPSFKPDLPASSSLVYPNPVNTSSDCPATTTTYPAPLPPSEASFYPPLSSIEHPPSSQPLVYSAPPYPYQYDSHHPEQPIYPPPPPTALNLYPPPYNSISPPQHQSYPPPPVTSYHQTQPSQSFHGYAPSSPQNHYGYVDPQPPPGHSYYQTQPSQSFHGFAPSSPQYQHGCVYPPQPPSSAYGYGSPTTQAPPKKNKPGLGLGMGAGLLGGALGGLLIGDLVSDVGFEF